MFQLFCTVHVAVRTQLGGAIYPYSKHQQLVFLEGIVVKWSLLV